MTVYKVRVYYGENSEAPYVDYEVDSPVSAVVGDKVVLNFKQGDINRPELIGVLESGTIPKVQDDIGQEFRNVRYIKNLSIVTNDKVLLTFIRGDPANAVIIQNIDTTQRIKVHDDHLGVDVQAYQSKNNPIPLDTTGVTVIFPRGDINEGVAIKPA